MNFTNKVRSWSTTLQVEQDDEKKFWGRKPAKPRKMGDPLPPPKGKLPKKNSDKKQFSISFINPDNTKDKSLCVCSIQPDQLVGFNNTYIIPINKNTSLSLLNELTYGVEPQQAVLEFSYYEL